jgi:hypothetical protein
MRGSSGWAKGERRKTLYVGNFRPFHTEFTEALTEDTEKTQASLRVLCVLFSVPSV